MKKPSLSALILLTPLLATGSLVFAYDPADDKPVCKKPRFTDFSLPEYNAATHNQQVTPEAAFFFKVPADVDPASITLIAKKKPLPFTVEKTSTFYKVTSKLPAEVSGHFVRLDVHANSTLGCDGEDGWLIKVSKHANQE